MDRRTLISLTGLAASALALALAPLALDPSYDWIRHTTSESGGQGVDGAWVARTGFLLFGLTVLHIAHQNRTAWGTLAAACHRFFGIAMIAVAVYSLRSWQSTVAYDETEDLLHSMAATAMGFAFAFGVVTVAIGQLRQGKSARLLDWVAVAASVALPLGMLERPSIAGLLQRLMFSIAYLWYARASITEQSDSAPEAPAIT